MLGRFGPRLSHGIVASCALLASVLFCVSALSLSGETSCSTLAGGAALGAAIAHRVSYRSAV